MAPRIFVFLATLLAVSAAAHAQEPFDIDAWHAGHPVASEDESPDRRFRLGLYPRVGVVVGIPNAIAGTAQISLSFRQPEKYDFYIGAGFEYGHAVKGGNVTLGWGGVREAPAVVRQEGFSGAFLRYRNWDSNDHGRHHGLSFGFESGLGAFGLSMEVGVARSEQNHWIPVARIGLSVGKAWLWKK